MQIVLDTSILLAERTFSSRQMETLLQFAHGSGSQILLLDVVLVELEGSRRRLVAEQSAAIESAIRKSLSQRLGVVEKVDRKTTVDKTIEALERDLARFLQWRRVVRTRETTIDAYMAAVRRAALRVKPTRPNGSGVRDAIIWESILEVCKATSEPVVFISANTSDFGDSSRAELHPQLASEVAEAGNRLTFFPDLGRFFKEVLEPTSFISADWVNDNLDRTELEKVLTRWVADSAGRPSSSVSFKLYDEKTARVYAIDGVDSPTSVSLQVTVEDAFAWNVPGGEPLLLFEVSAYVGADFNLSRQAHLTWREAAEILGESPAYDADLEIEPDIDDIVPRSTVEQGWAELLFQCSAVVREGRPKDIEIVDVNSL